MSLKLIVAGGGSGGHIFPGIAVARALLARSAESKARFIGSSRALEASILAANRFESLSLDVSGFKGVGAVGKMTALLRLIPATFKAARYIVDFRADAILGTGGYASIPGALGAILTRRPLYLTEQNYEPGMATRHLASSARKIFITWPESERFFPAGKAVLTGNPIRAEFRASESRAPSKESDPMKVLILGGSQGARTINEGVAGAIGELNELSDRLIVTHQTGRGAYDSIAALYESADYRHEVAPFFDDIGARLIEADYVVSRAGAGAIAEILATRRAALYIPFPGAGAHQDFNARYLLERGACDVVADEEFTSPRFAAIVRAALADRSRLSEMSRAAAKLARPDAADRVLDHIISDLQGERAR